jgi:hypothetical protein
VRCTRDFDPPPGSLHSSVGRPDTCLSQQKKIKYLFDHIRIHKQEGQPDRADYVRAWKEGKGRNAEICVQVWKGKTCPEGEPDGDWGDAGCPGPGNCDGAVCGADVKLKLKAHERAAMLLASNGGGGVNRLHLRIPLYKNQPCGMAHYVGVPRKGLGRRSGVLDRTLLLMLKLGLIMRTTGERRFRHRGDGVYRLTAKGRREGMKWHRQEELRLDKWRLQFFQHNDMAGAQ